MVSREHWEIASRYCNMESDFSDENYPLDLDSIREFVLEENPHFTERDVILIKSIINGKEFNFTYFEIIESNEIRVRFLKKTTFLKINLGTSGGEGWLDNDFCETEAEAREMLNNYTTSAERNIDELTEKLSEVSSSLLLDESTTSRPELERQIESYQDRLDTIKRLKIIKVSITHSGTDTLIKREILT